MLHVTQTVASIRLLRHSVGHGCGAHSSHCRIPLFNNQTNSFLYIVVKFGVARFICSLGNKLVHQRGPHWFGVEMFQFSRERFRDLNLVLLVYAGLMHINKCAYNGQLSGIGEGGVESHEVSCIRSPLSYVNHRSWSEYGWNWNGRAITMRGISMLIATILHCVPKRPPLIF